MSQTRRKCRNLSCVSKVLFAFQSALFCTEQPAATLSAASRWLRLVSIARNKTLNWIHLWIPWIGSD